MKVSDTRDSSLQVLPSTGYTGGNSAFLNLQTNYNNMNVANEFDDVSIIDWLIESLSSHSLYLRYDIV